MHVPLSPPLPPAPGRGIYGASLGEMDALVGRIKELADSLGRGSTLLWFTGTAGQRPGGDTGDSAWRRGQDLCLCPALDVRCPRCPMPSMSLPSMSPALGAPVALWMGWWSQRGHGGPRLRCPPSWVPTLPPPPAAGLERWGRD